jgi:hypothetical protein
MEAFEYIAAYVDFKWIKGHNNHPQTVGVMN